MSDRPAPSQGPRRKLPARARTPRNNALIGAILVVLALGGLVVAYTKHSPFTGHGYELKAVFRNAATLRSDSPVRIAGVTVGKVLSVAHDGNDAEVTFTVASSGQPIHSDAEVTIRPRLFLEGNFFLDVTPGSPSASDLSSGSTIPVTRTATAVQLDQVLSALQAPERYNLQRLLASYGNALTRTPTAAQDATQDPQVQGISAAAALNDSFNYGARAGKGTAITAQALRGTGPHDLSNLIAAQSRVFGALLSRESQLQDLITNFNVFTGALAAESSNLSATIAQLAPTLEEAQPSLRALNASFPSLRAFAVDARPGVEELPATINAGLPWLHQANALVRKSELGGLVQLLHEGARPTAKALTATSGFLPQLTLTSRCVSGVLVPAGNTVINDSFSTGQPNFHDFFYGLTGLAGIGQNFDGNGSYLRVNAGGGPTLVKAKNPNGGPANGSVYGHTISAPLGTQPAYQSSGEPAYRPDVPCFKNPLPDLNGPAGQSHTPDLKVVP
ncbi:MAG: phospholipid/cholesterol/gamma-HCH transport system substrate-binding protein [Gaiellaceae bacterium]|nr:phospholipid/cholesterol/gamma-HCH transport system substrate-binding protein [Gaiellaceae bacterium]